MAIALSVALVGCGGGGGGGGGDPLAGGPAVEDIRLQPGDRPVRFRLDTAVPQATQDFLVETLAWAHADLGDSGPLTIHVYSNEDHFVEAYVNDFAIDRQTAREKLDNGQFAFESPGGHIWIYLPNFDADPPEQRRLTLFHEYFHTVQGWLAEIRFQSVKREEQSFVPRWLVEGCAEYLAVHAGAKRGLIDEREYGQVMVEEAQGAETLVVLETSGAASFLGGSQGAYTAGYLACERLSTTRGQDTVMRRFWASLATQRSWDRAFNEAFAMTPVAFYNDFAAYRLTL